MLKYIKPFIFEPANNIAPGLEFLSNMHFIIQIYDASWYASLKETLCCITHNAYCATAENASSPTTQANRRGAIVSKGNRFMITIPLSICNPILGFLQQIFLQN